MFKDYSLKLAGKANLFINTNPTSKTQTSKPSQSTYSNSGKEDNYVAFEIDSKNLEDDWGQKDINENEINDKTEVDKSSKDTKYTQVDDSNSSKQVAVDPEHRTGMGCGVKGWEGTLPEILQKWKDGTWQIPDPSEYVEPDTPSELDIVNQNRSKTDLWYEPYNMHQEIVDIIEVERTNLETGEKEVSYTTIIKDITMNPEITPEEAANGIVSKERIEHETPTWAQGKDWHSDVITYADGSILVNFYMNGELVSQEQTIPEEGVDVANMRDGDTHRVTKYTFESDGSYTKTFKSIVYDAETGMGMSDLVDFSFCYDPEGNPIKKYSREWYEHFKPDFYY